MRSQETLHALEAAGVHLTLDTEGRIRMQFPAAIRDTVRPLLEDLRAHREEVADLLRHRTPEHSARPCVACSATTDDFEKLYCATCWTDRRVHGTPSARTDVLSSVGYVTIRSRYLGADVVVRVSAAVPVPERFIVFELEEVARLLTVPRDAAWGALHDLYRVKRQLSTDSRLTALAAVSSRSRSARHAPPQDNTLSRPSGAWLDCGAGA